MALKHVKNKITSTKKTGQVTNAMESVSAVKMRKSQERAFSGRPYVRAALRILSRIAGSQEVTQSPYVTSQKTGVPLLIIVTSDKGLAGSVNSVVLKCAEKLILRDKTYEVVCIGRKAVDFARRISCTVHGEYTNIKDDVTVNDVYRITETVIKGFTSGTFASVSVVHQNFLSTFEQEPVVRQLLPLKRDELLSVVAGIAPTAGKFSEESTEISDTISYTVEPSPEAVFQSLIPQLVEVMLYHALLESKASEHSARMVAMKNATDKSKEMVKALTIEYNKERQAAITAEVSEITAGVEAMK